MRRAFIQILALRAWRLEHGSYPQRLHELVGEYLAKLPVDPFSEPEKGPQPFLYRISPGENLRISGKAYRTDPGQPILYSRGHNQIDDGGHLDEHENTFSTDMLFPMPR